MKIMLVRPRPEKETIGLQHVMIVEPLELEVIASTVNEECVIVDMILEKKSIEYFIKKEKPDVLAITGYITNVNTIIRYCKIAKEINYRIITIVGGVHIEVVPEDLDNVYIDFRVVRNATTEFPKLIKHLKFEEKLPKCVFKHKEKVEFNKLPEINFHYPLPNRKLTKKYRNKYFYIFHDKVALIKTAFGCPYKCDFCFCRKITYDQYHPRKVDDVLDELQEIKEQEIYIVDDDFLINKVRVTEFLDGLEKRNIKKNYLIYARSDFIIKNQDLVKRFKRLGLKTVIVGFESFNEEELGEYNKAIDVKTNEECMNFLNQVGIDCYATIIINPDWDYKDFERLEKKLKELKIKYVNLQPLTPLPKTDFSIDEERLCIKREEYEKWDLAHISVKPTKMSVPEFYNQIIKLYNKIVFRPNVLINHLKHSPMILFRMIKGSFLVHRQYKQKYLEALQYA